MSVYLPARIWTVSISVLLFLAIAPANGQQPQPQSKKDKAEAQPVHRPEGPNENYTLQTYEVGDLIISVQDHPYSDALLRQSLKAANGGGGSIGGGGGGFFSVPMGVNDRKLDRSKTTSEPAPIMLSQFGGGGAGGGLPGAARGEAGAAGFANSSGVSMDDLVRVLVSTVDSNSWVQNGGEGRVEPLGTALVVYQAPAVHRLIATLLDQIREPAGRRKTMTIDARWLTLTSDDLDSLLTKDSTGLPEADGKTLATLTRRSGSIRGLTSCFSGQLVYLTSGTSRNVVSGWIPVVGAIGTGDSAASLASAHSKPRIRLIAETSSADFTRGGRGVGYQPIVGSSNLGALLEIRPTIIGASKWAVVELKSTLTSPAERPADPGHNPVTDALAPAVDRLAVETLELATTLRMPIGKPIVVGGITYMPGSAKARDDADKAERQQIYLVLEIR